MRMIVKMKGASMKKILILILTAILLAVPAYAATGVVATQNTNLNVRSQPSASSPVIASFKKGEMVELISKSNGWWKVKLWDGYGYCSASYINEIDPSTYGAKTLNVPNYKQYDSRWASVRLGTQGGTIRTIGCTATGLAMLESVRTGTTVTPANIAYTFSFTAGGAVYWPDRYMRTSPTNYLAFIAARLNEGKPVIVHGQTAGGSTHWVVVKSYNGNGLTTANFGINDPASATRTTLASFFAAYPYFVKLAYYAW